MLDFQQGLINGTLCKVLRRLHYLQGVMLTSVRRYGVHPLSLWLVEEMQQACGVFVHYSTVRRRAVRMLPVLIAVLLRRKRPVGLSWRMDETYIKVAGHQDFQDKNAV